jgi:adenylate kinase family enzyme
MNFDNIVNDILKTNKSNLLQMIYEGYYDPAIFKAVFMIGGSGSGKTYITKKLGLAHMGFTQINSDYPLEKYMKKAGLNMKMPDSEEQERTKVREKAIAVSDARIEQVLNERLGLYIDGTGANKSDTIAFDERLRQLGYDTAMVFVNTNLKTALERNAMRERTVPERIAERKWHEVQANIGFYKNHFRNFFVIDNSNGMTSETEKQVTETYKNLLKWSKEKPKNQTAINFINELGRKKGILPSKK